MEQIFAEKISTATIAIAVFGLVFCLMQTKYSPVSRSFALFLAAVTLNNIPDALNRGSEPWQDFAVVFTELVLWLPSALCLAPLFWIYVFTLTSTSQRRPAQLLRHFLLPALALLIGLILLGAPAEVGQTFITGEASATSGWTFALFAVGLLQIAVYPQMAVYLFLILRRMVQFRRRLRDYYASTQEHELRWIYVIGAFGVVFWLARTIIFLLATELERQDIPAALTYIAGFASLALVVAMTLWGLRQRPPLMPRNDNEPPTTSLETQASEQRGEKYEKSALSSEASARIARKLRAAMEQDKLHRDPNLSLWALARHIGASPNYISQTLNEVIGESFFDFVNGHRVAEAMTRLSDSNDTVLTITYDVGFNARSSFYNAFKRVTGQTPTHYRKSLSRPDGTDDHKHGLRNI